MNDNLRRIIIATILSFAFFVAYDYFVIQPQMKINETNQTKVEKRNTNVSNSKVVNAKTLVIVNSKEYKIEIDEFGRIAKFLLKEKKFDKNGKEINLISPNLPKPLEVRFQNEKLNKLAYSVAYKSDVKELNIDNKPKTLTLTQNLNGVVIKKIITFYPNGRYDIKIDLNKQLTYFISPGYRPSVAVDTLTIHGKK